MDYYNQNMRNTQDYYVEYLNEYDKPRNKKIQEKDTQKNISRQITNNMNQMNKMKQSLEETLLQIDKNDKLIKALIDVIQLQQ